MKKRAFIFALLLLLVIPMIFLSSCGEEELEAGQLSVNLNSSGKKLKITVMPDSDLLDEYAKSDLCLFAFAPGESTDDFEGKEPIDKKGADEKVDFKLPLVDKDSGMSRLYHGFVAAFYDKEEDAYVSATSVAYVKNPETLAENKENFPTAKSIKGICAEYDTDAIALGVSHVIIDIPIEEYLLAEGNFDAESHTVGKNTAFIDGNSVRTLDKRVKYYTDNGVIVYLRFILKASAEELPEGLKTLAYPETVAGSESYAVNMNDSGTAAAVACLADFLAGRYTAEDSPRGNVSAFIAGGALNTPGATAPDVRGETYIKGVSRFVRTLYTAIASHYENGRVYLSIDHRWKTAGDGTADTTGHKFLTKFDEMSKDAGDYPWGIALMTQATSADTDRIWHDNSGDGDYLTPSNLEPIFEDFLDSSKHYYDDEERSLIISDFSVQTTDSSNTESNQAASYAYAYYMAADTGKIEAFVYSMQVDTETSAAGLRARTDEGLPSAEREIYSVMKNITADSELEEFVEEVTDSDSDWDSLYDDNSDTVIISKLCDGRGKVEQGEPDELIEDYKASTLFLFTEGNMNGFKSVRVGSCAGLTADGLKISYANPTSAEIGYVYKTGLSKSDFSNDNLLIKLGEVEVDCSVTLVLIQKNGKKTDVIYESTARDIEAGSHALLDFDISSFRKELLKGDIEMRISAVGADGLACDITVEEILSGKEKSNTVVVVILIVLASTAFVAIIVLGVVWFRKHYKIEIDRSPKKAEKAKKAKKEKTRDLLNEEFHE